MTWQSLQAPHDLGQQANSRSLGVDPALSQEGGKFIMLILKFVDIVQLGESVYLVRWKTQHFRRFAHSAPYAISDHVRCHRRTAFAVAAVDVLNYLFTLLTARQIDIDVGPFTTLL